MSERRFQHIEDAQREHGRPRSKGEPGCDSLGGFALLKRRARPEAPQQAPAPGFISFRAGFGPGIRAGHRDKREFISLETWFLAALRVEYPEAGEQPVNASRQVDPRG